MNARSRRAVRWLVALLAGTPALSPAPSSAAVPDGLQVQGQLLTSSGVPATGSYDLVLRLFAAQSGGSALLTKTFSSVPVGAGGVFDVQVAPAAATVLAAPGALWLEVAVAGEPPLPRTPLLAAPFAIAAQRADSALDLACSGCVDAAEVAFPYAAAATKGGAATDLDCAGCVDAAALGAASVGVAQLQDGAVGAAKLGVAWAAGTSAGGPAADLACTGCVAGGEIAPNAALAGNVSASGSLTACTGGTGGGCGVALGTTAALRAATGGAQLQAQALLIRTADGSAWAPLSAGATTVQGALTTAGGAGVGTAAPATGLAVVGTGSGTDPLLEASAGASRLLVRHDGRVGVGTASPAALLHVAGDARFDGPVTGLRLAPSASAPATCGPSTAGAIWFDSDDKGFFGCDGTAWIPLSGGGTGSATPKSCSAIKLGDPSATSGQYTINPTGAPGKTVQVYCDMTTDGGGWTLVAQRNQYGSFDPSWAVSEKALATLASYDRDTDLGTGRVASLDVNAYMAASGDTILRAERIHPVTGGTSLSFDWTLRGLNLTYNPSPQRMFWYGTRFWCTGDGADCKAHSGLGNGWDISTGTSGNQWLTHWPGGFLHANGYGDQVSYNSGGVAWIYLWSRAASIPSTSYASCKAILDAGKSTGNGVYTITPYAEPNFPVQVYCDMAGGGWTLIAQRNQYSSFHAGFGVQDINLPALAQYQPNTDLGGLRLACLNVNRFMAGTGATTLLVHKRHPTGSSTMDFAWGSRSQDLLYTPSASRMFWYSSRYWCTGDGSNCKGHGGLGAGWDISASGSGNQWLTYWPGGFQIGISGQAQVDYGQSGVAWIYLWAR